MHQIPKNQTSVAASLRRTEANYDIHFQGKSKFGSKLKWFCIPLFCTCLYMFKEKEKQWQTYTCRFATENRSCGLTQNQIICQQYLFQVAMKGVTLL